MDFISAILNFLSEIWSDFRPFFIVREYEGAVVLRFGRVQREAESGLHWKIPFVDEVLTCMIATETISVKSQSLTTLDDKNIVISAAIKCYVSNPKKYLIKVRDVTDAISDIAQGKIKSIIMAKTWDECRGDIDSEITKLVKPEAVKWGITIDYVTVTDLAIIKTFRLIQE
jgi:regulator of protease activity HflC (stomatin/prohibitin superfamily)